MNYILDFKNESFFIDQTQILFDINLKVEEGEFIVVLGQNGSGKSSFFKLIKSKINNFYELNQDTNKSTFSELSVCENLKLASDNKCDKNQLIYFKDKLDIKVKDLSGGQRQVLALSMAFLQNPKILLLDEHTSALDPNTAQKVMESTDENIKNNHLTALMITHNIDFALKFGSRILVIKNGQIKNDINSLQKAKLSKEELLSLLI